MVGSIERIEQEIAALNQAVTELSEELHDTYSSYLTVLGQAVRQQLILASYQVCTQGYPEQFLQLSYNQRQQVQKTLRHLAEQVQEELLAQLHTPIVPEEPEADLGEAHPMYPLLLETAIASEPKPPNRSSEPRRLTPADLVQWQQDLEQAIVNELRTASHAANRLLQQANILPKKLPEPVLEAASKSEMSEVGGTSPNLLTLLVDAVSEEAVEKHKVDDPKAHSVMHIVAVHLRLSDIEFAETALSVVRSKLRNLSANLKSLGREYQKKHRERAIAEAQAAWRTSWTEE